MHQYTSAYEHLNPSNTPETVQKSGHQGLTNSCFVTATMSLLSIEVSCREGEESLDHVKDHQFCEQSELIVYNSCFKLKFFSFTDIWKDKTKK